MSIAREAQWIGEGKFKDAVGNSVGSYDDVALLNALVGRDKYGVRLEIPAGTIATVLCFQDTPDGLVELECDWPQGSFSFAQTAKDTVRFHESAAQKYWSSDPASGSNE